jgi:TPR repeat protein
MNVDRDNLIRRVPGRGSAAPGADPVYQLGLAAYRTGDFAHALEAWTRAARGGDTAAQFGLGVLYDEGAGVPRDRAEAARWYRLAAAQGDAVAQFNLAELSLRGLGVAKNRLQALRWYRMAAAQGHLGAVERLKRLGFSD